MPRARRLLDELEESLLGIRETAARRRGLVTLACIPTAAYYFLPETLAAFARRFPEMRVRIMDLSGDAVSDAVASGAVDFGVGMEGVQHPQIEFRPLRQDPFVLACRHDHRLAARRNAVRWGEARRRAAGRGFAPVGQPADPRPRPAPAQHQPGLAI